MILSECEGSPREAHTDFVGVRFGKNGTNRLSATRIGVGGDAFYATALASGARSKHEPALHPEYHAGYYAAFVWDHHDNKVEAVFHDRA